MKRVLFVVLFAAGCKQGLNDPCQVTADCQSGLVCGTASGKCQESSTSGDIDATVPDGPKLDAAIDAPLDAPRDAPPD